MVNRRIILFSPSHIDIPALPNDGLAKNRLVHGIHQDDEKKDDGKKMKNRMNESELADKFVDIQDKQNIGQISQEKRKKVRRVQEKWKEFGQDDAGQPQTAKHQSRRPQQGSA